MLYTASDDIAYKRLEKIVIIKNGKDYKHLTKRNIPVYGSGGIMTCVSEYAYNKPTVLIPFAKVHSGISLSN